MVKFLIACFAGRWQQLNIGFDTVQFARDGIRELRKMVDGPYVLHPLGSRRWKHRITR